MSNPALPRIGDRVRITQVGEYSLHYDTGTALSVVGKVTEARVSPHLGDWLEVGLVLDDGRDLYCGQCRCESVAKAVA